jgi:hypothetical protein
LIYPTNFDHHIQIEFVDRLIGPSFCKLLIGRFNDIKFISDSDRQLSISATSISCLKDQINDFSQVLINDMSIIIKKRHAKCCFSVTLLIKRRPFIKSAHMVALMKSDNTLFNACACSANKNPK